MEGYRVEETYAARKNTVIFRKLLALHHEENIWLKPFFPCEKVKKNINININMFLYFDILIERLHCTILCTILCGVVRPGSQTAGSAATGRMF